MQRVLVEAGAPRHVVADHVHEVEHLEGAGKLEADDLMTVGCHGPVKRSCTFSAGILERKCMRPLKYASSAAS
jgi:hypothetical protein